MDARSRRFRCSASHGRCPPGVGSPAHVPAGRPARAVTRRGCPALPPPTSHPRRWSRHSCRRPEVRPTPPIVRLRSAHREDGRDEPQRRLPPLLDVRAISGDHAYDPAHGELGPDRARLRRARDLRAARRTSARSRSATGSAPARATRPTPRPASRTSSSTCSSRARAATARSRSPRSSTGSAAS